MHSEWAKNFDAPKFSFQNRIRGPKGVLQSIPKLNSRHHMKPFPGYRPSHPINNEASLSLIAKKYMYSNLRGVRKLFEQTYLKCLEQSLLFSLGDHSCPPRPGAGFLWIRQKLVQALPNCGSFGHLCRTMPSPARTLHCPWAHKAGIFYT